MKTFLTGVLLILLGILIAGLIGLTTAPPRGEPVTLLPPPTPLPLVVYVTGAVVKPGLARLPEGCRVQDAVDAVGGVLPEADLSHINLAAPVIDGSQIIIPAGSVSALSPESPSAVTAPEALININTATSEEIAALPEIGTVTAQRIVEYRTQFGPFTTVEDLLQVFGVGPGTLEKIKGLITVAP